MSFVSRKKPLKPPESMAQIVASMVLLKCDARLRSNAHIVGAIIPNSHAMAQFEFGSTHPQNPHTVIVAPFVMKDARRKLNTINGAVLLRRVRGVEINRQSYMLEEFDACVSDLLTFMDAGDKPASLVQRKGLP